MKISTKNLSRNNQLFCPVYHMTTKYGLLISILPIGASIQKIAFIMEDGRELSIALSFPSASAYEELLCYAGATLGPNAGRIGNARLTIQNTEYLLSQNDNSHQLHGGIHNLSAMVWDVTSFDCTDDTASIRLSASQPDGMDGYPGHRNYQVCYTLTEQGILTIEYSAWTDQPTYINLSNHTYWNLSGDFTMPALNQELTIYADRVCTNDKEHIPIDFISVSNTAFDFRVKRSLDSAIHSSTDPVSTEQLQIGRGYNHAYLLNSCDSNAPQNVRSAIKLQPACLLHDPASKRSVKLLTDAPAMVLYSGGYLPSGVPLSNGQYSVLSCAVALEAQDLPDCMHLLPSSFHLTLPDEPFHRTIQYQIL